MSAEGPLLGSAGNFYSVHQKKKTHKR